MTSKIAQKICLTAVSALSLGLIAQGIESINNSNIANAQDAGLEASLTGAGASFPAPSVSTLVF